MSSDTGETLVRVRPRTRSRWSFGGPWWVRVLLVYGLSRLFTTAVLLIFAHFQGANPWTGADPGYFSYADIWDGYWYRSIGAVGYPTVLPRLVDGHIAQNAWAFLPGYPILVDGFAFVFRIPWDVAAVVVSVVSGAGACLVFYRLMLRVGLNASACLFAVVLFCVAPVSPLFQLAYAESLYMLLLAVALLCVVQRRYLWLFPLIPAMAFTRPSAIPFALFLGLHFLFRWFRRHESPFPRRERLLGIVVTLFAGLAAIAWPIIAAIATGVTSAYTQTELAWRAGYVGYGHLVPFTSWFQGAGWWFGVYLGSSPWVGYLVVLLLIIMFTLVLFLPGVVRLGTDLRLWIASYGLYLLAVFYPQSSLFRLLMPMFPLLGALALPRSRLYRFGLVIVSLALQIGWIALCWGIDGHDWTPP